ncbi:MAG: tyrosine-type recombinase/integrase [Alphaproteobacteria bacterium]|nr:tyrosine-type recombinase/integrase [Alphaproteobacteria bacterium]
MPLKLIPPGRRKGNPYWIARGVVAGKLREFSTGEVDKAAAEAFAIRAAGKIVDGHSTPDPERMTFRMAANAYEAWRTSSRSTRARIKKLADHFAAKPIRTIVQADLVAAADELYAGKKAATKNRCVVTIASAVLHYAASNKWCEYQRFRRFKEPRPVTRAVSLETMGALVEATEGKMQLLMIVLFGLGQRITDTLQIDWSDIDLVARTVAMTIGKKNDEPRVFPLPDPVWEAIANQPKDVVRKGRLFPWRSRSGVYIAMRKLKGLPAERFTPHMARHTLGTLLNASGAGLRTIMTALGHDDPKSSMRYQDADTEIVRIAQTELGKYLGKRQNAS